MTFTINAGCGVQSIRLWDTSGNIPVSLWLSCGPGRVLRTTTYNPDPSFVGDFVPPETMRSLEMGVRHASVRLELDFRPGKGSRVSCGPMASFEGFVFEESYLVLLGYCCADGRDTIVLEAESFDGTSSASISRSLFMTHGELCLVQDSVTPRYLVEGYSMNVAVAFTRRLQCADTLGCAVQGGGTVEDMPSMLTANVVRMRVTAGPRATGIRISGVKSADGYELHDVFIPMDLRDTTEPDILLLRGGAAPSAGNGVASVSVFGSAASDDEGVSTNLGTATITYSLTSPLPRRFTLFMYGRYQGDFGHPLYPYLFSIRFGGAVPAVRGLAALRTRVEVIGGGVSLPYRELSLGEWHLFCMVCDISGYSCFVDGTMVTRDTPHAGSASASLVILNNYGGTILNSGLHSGLHTASVGIFFRALSGPQMVDLGKRIRADIQASALTKPANPSRRCE